jgi:hypothetical protein
MQSVRKPLLLDCEIERLRIAGRRQSTNLFLRYELQYVQRLYRWLGCQCCVCRPVLAGIAMRPDNYGGTDDNHDLHDSIAYHNDHDDNGVTVYWIVRMALERCGTWMVSGK